MSNLVATKLQPSLHAIKEPTPTIATATRARMIAGDTGSSGRCPRSDVSPVRRRVSCSSRSSQTVLGATVGHFPERVSRGRAAPAQRRSSRLESLLIRLWKNRGPAKAVSARKRQLLGTAGGPQRGG